MNQDWILQTQETKRFFSKATWIPLRSVINDEQGNCKEIGYKSEYFGCYSVAFPPEHRNLANGLTWSDFGGRGARPYAYADGYYSSVEQYEYNDKEPIGVQLIFDYPQPVIGGHKWIVNPDLIIALGLIKDGNNWLRPEENFTVVIQEELDNKGNHVSINIKREFLLDYLAARNLNLRLSYYRQRVENVTDLANSIYQDLKPLNQTRNGGDFKLRIININDVFGGGWNVVRTWRTDVDINDDVPVMDAENNENTDSENYQSESPKYLGTRVEGEFWRNEWIEHQGRSVRIRYDDDPNLPSFIVDNDSSRMHSSELNSEDIRRWLWFKPEIINELLNYKGFSLEWYSAETGAIHSTSGYRIHFGINSSDLIVVYAYDIARLNSWEQHIWVAYNITPEGKLPLELYSSQVLAQPADTLASEVVLFKLLHLLEHDFRNKFGMELFSHDINDFEYMQRISRFKSRDKYSLLTLAKELVKVFTDRLNLPCLREISNHKDKKTLASNKLLQSIVASYIGEQSAYKIFTPIVGIYDMRVGDAHPTSSKIDDAIKLVGIDETQSYLKQGKQLITILGQAIISIGRALFLEK